MGIKVGIDFSGFEQRFSNQNLNDAKLLAANDAHQTMEKYVPKLSGNLRSESSVAKNGENVIYETPYARAQFYGVINGGKVRNYSTPGTGKRWDLRLKGNKADMDKITDAFVRGVFR